ncbi:MAG: PIN domain-containing protein [Deltaproteobacteria bacterium]|nr:PIN domain-containing protein [Deltaproteobacteria bacterium]
MRTINKDGEQNSIFVDSSVFLKHFLKGDHRAFKFLRSSHGMVTSDIVINEVLYILMKQYVENKYDLRHYDAIKFLKDPDKFDESPPK